MSNDAFEEVWDNIGVEMEDPGYESGYESEQDEAQLVGNYQEWIDAAEHLRTNEPGSWNDADWVQHLRVNHEYG